MEKFSLALVPITTDQQQSPPSTVSRDGTKSIFVTKSTPSSTIFKPKISTSPLSKTRRGPKGEVVIDDDNVNIVNTIDLSSIPLLEAPKLDDDNDDNDQSNSHDLDDKFIEKRSQLEKNDRVHISDNDNENENSDVTSKLMEQNKEKELEEVTTLGNPRMSQQHRLTSLFAERYFEAIQEVRKECYHERIP